MTACGSISGDESTPDGTVSDSVESQSGNGGTPRRTSSGLVEGKDYLVLKRVRILDEMGFDRPVEAMSMLVPSGWRAEGGVRWKSVNECRGEIVSWPITLTSPDGAIRYSVLPVRSFEYSQDPTMQQVLMAASRQGGCQVSPPFNAAQYLENLARTQLGATVSNVRSDESLQASLDKMSASNNATSQQYGTATTMSGSGVYGTLTWPDGTKGLAQIGVMVIMTQSRDMYTGAPNGGASTSVFHQVVMRYPAARETEALKLFGTIGTSHRMNPIWTQAKEGFLTRLGNVEHAGRMERLRLMGEQSKAYAKSQSDASDARMRDWERGQASSDAGQRRFIQTIREVETWKDGEGNPVELNAGYSHGWSRPDGSFILTNNSNFDPAVELKQNWSRMEKPPR
ncbi:MAG: hypothetical protein WCD76_11255 [Pyrinomonadaceae bacterium]